MLEDIKGDLWYKMLRVKYGEEGALEGGGRDGSVWWKELLQLASL